MIKVQDGFCRFFTEPIFVQLKTECQYKCINEAANKRGIHKLVTAFDSGMWIIYNFEGNAGLGVTYSSSWVENYCAKHPDYSIVRFEDINSSIIHIESKEILELLGG